MAVPASRETMLDDASSEGSSLRGNTPEVIIEADSASPSEDSESITSSTRSIRTSVFDYVYEHGRRYHGYSQGSYLLPNDDEESTRLILQHWVFRRLLGDREYFAPLENPGKILDIGTGTGIWAIKIAEEFPNAKVRGTDLSPTQAEYYPDNVEFVIDDAANEDWGKKRYDYIHTRMLLGCFEDFREIIKRSFKSLEPGGWMESHELYPTVYCDDDTLPANSPFLEWTKTQDEAAMKLRKPLRIANKLKKWYEQAGFIDVHEEVFKLPVNGWPKDPQFKMLGRFWESSLMDGLQGFSLALFHRAFGWSQGEIEVYLVNVRRAIADRSVHAYHKIYVVWGRKPEDSASASQS